MYFDHIGTWIQLISNYPLNFGQQAKESHSCMEGCKHKPHTGRAKFLHLSKSHASLLKPYTTTRPPTIN